MHPTVTMLQLDSHITSEENCNSRGTQSSQKHYQLEYAETEGKAMLLTLVGDLHNIYNPY